MSTAAEKKRRQHFNMTAEKRLAKKDKNKLHMRSFRLEMTIGEKNIKMENNKTQKKGEEQHSPQRKGRNACESQEQHEEITPCYVSEKKGRNERESKQWDEEFTHVSPPKDRNECESMKRDEEFMHVSSQNAEMNMKACNRMRIYTCLPPQKQK